MPELPEVETTLRGIEPHITNQKVKRVVVRHKTLRWPIPNKQLQSQLVGQTIINIQRRAKYLLLTCKNGTLIIHLGMSGRLSILTKAQPAQKHDHFDIEFANKKTLRLTDPRRFGAVLWAKEPNEHLLLKNLGTEPLDKKFTGKYLQDKFKNKNTATKVAIMDHHIVVGVGNIYAAESLFLANIHPLAPAKSLTLEQLNQLASAIKSILKQAIKQGGTTLRDFLDTEGNPGYFVNKLNVYGRDGLPCYTCGNPLSHKKIGQRSTVFCADCQLLNP